MDQGVLCRPRQQDVYRCGALLLVASSPEPEQGALQERVHTGPVPGPNVHGAAQQEPQEARGERSGEGEVA
eukprot:1152798-Pelagomonas_calceolata.AAC.2